MIYAGVVKEGGGGGYHFVSSAGYPKLASTLEILPPRLPADEEEVPLCRQTRKGSSSAWAAWADWLAQAVRNRISSVLAIFGYPADKEK